MGHRRFVAAAFMIAISIAASGPASAQCIECGMQMQQAWHSNVITKGVYDSMKRDQQRRQAPPQARTVREVNVQQLQDAALAPLGLEFERRVRTDGKDSAVNWLVAATKPLGSQVGGLMPQYRERVRSQGQAAANAWYLNAARAIGTRYVQASR